MMIRAMKFPMDHMRLVCSIAWSFHFTTGLPFDDLYAEACLEYCNASKVFEKKKRRAKFTTYMYSFVTNQLIFYTLYEARRKNVIWEMEYRKREYEQTPQYEYFNNNFPRDVQVVVDYVLSTNGEISDVPPKLARGIVYRYLKSIGWSHKKAWEVIQKTRQIVTQTEMYCII